MNPLHNKLIVVLAGLLAFQAVAMLLRYLGEIGPNGQFGGDFISFWQAAKRVRAGEISAIYDAESWRAVLASGGRKQLSWFVYPPFALFGLWPLGRLTYNEAVVVWSLLPLPFYFALVALLVRRSHRLVTGAKGEVPADPVLLALLIAAALPFLSANLFTGQTGAYLAAFLMAAAWWWGRRPILAGIAIGLLAIKPQMGLLIPLALAAAGQWRMFAAATGTITVLAAAATIWLGPGIWGEYLAMTRVFAELMGQGYAGIRQLAIGPYVSLLGIGAPALLAGVVQAAGMAVVATAVVRAFRFSPSGPEVVDDSQDLRLGLLAAGVLLVTPYSLSYDTPLLILAVIPVVVRAWFTGTDLLELVALTALLVIPYAQPVAVAWGFPFGAIAVSLWFFVLCRRCGVKGRAATLAASH